MKIKEIGIIALLVIGLGFGGYEIFTKIMKPVDNAYAQESAVVATSRALGVTKYISDQVLTPNSTTASSLTVPATANCALVTVETANVRVRMSGTAPTTSAGHLVGPSGAGQTIWLSNRDQLVKFQAISVLALGTLMISYGD